MITVKSNSDSGFMRVIEMQMNERWKYTDNIPLKDVDIFLLDQEILLNTNEDGIFSFDKEILHNSYIRFYKIGYASKLVRYENGDDRLSIFLEKLHVDIDEIGVHDSYNELGNSKVTNIEKKSMNYS